MIKRFLQLLWFLISTVGILISGIGTCIHKDSLHLQVMFCVCFIVAMSPVIYGVIYWVITGKVIDP